MGKNEGYRSDGPGMINTINLLFYASAAEADAGKRLLRMIGTVVPRKMIKIHRTIRGLARRFRRPLADPAIAIIFISCGEELGDIIAIRDLLLGVPLILILPDNNKDTVAKAHSLRPRFLTYTDSDVREVSVVLSRMIERLGKGYSY